MMCADQAEIEGRQIVRTPANILHCTDARVDTIDRLALRDRRLQRISGEADTPHAFGVGVNARSACRDQPHLEKGEWIADQCHNGHAQNRFGWRSIFPSGIHEPENWQCRRFGRGDNCRYCTIAKVLDLCASTNSGGS